MNITRPPTRAARITTQTISSHQPYQAMPQPSSRAITASPLKSSFSLGVNEGLPENEQADIYQPAERAEGAVGFGQKGQMQHAEQGDQQPALPLAQYAGQALERCHERLPALMSRS
jgi:hypothetical protein